VLQQSGWTVGGNLRVDARWVAGDPVEDRTHAAELVALASDVVLAPGAVALGSLLQATSIVPVVFVNVPEPVGAGFVESLAQPSGGSTGSHHLWDWPIRRYPICRALRARAAGTGVSD
jgi:putative ABC transport system substrate-binding protein